MRTVLASRAHIDEPVHVDVHQLFTLVETAWLERAHGVSARTGAPVSLVSDIGVVGGLPLPWCPGREVQTALSARAHSVLKCPTFDALALA
jgi:hypothetical protein